MYTCLHAAVHGCCTNETLKEIISHKVYLDAQDTDGETALWLACSYRQQDSVRILLEAGPYPNIADNNGDTCLHAAVIGGCSKNIISTILDHGAGVNATNKNNETALIIACRNGNKSAINVLCNAGADPNIADVDNYTCLYKSVSAGCNKQALQTMIDFGADVNASNKDNATALMIACAKGNTDAINVLLDAGADPNITDANGYTCLSHAGYGECSKDELQAIIDHGADVNTTNKQKKTALMWACEKGNADAINVLLNAEADPTITDANGNTCLHTAVSEVAAKRSFRQ